MTAKPAALDLTPLDPCVHCGFCLQACPTYLATGDEADSPRGRIVLMRGLERGELDPDDPALLEHLDACLGCRGCEPACPSGVGYGRGLAATRTSLARRRGLPPLERGILAVFRRASAWRPLLTAAAWLRASGIPRLLAGEGRLGFAMGMLAATRDAAPPDGAHGPEPRDGPVAAPSTGGPASASGVESAAPTVALFRGCVMDTLFRHVHAATRRTLEANGYRVVDVPGQTCCGALHEHAGDRAGAEALARANLAALADAADFVVVDSAGCGAMLKDYGHLLGESRAAALAAKVRDVSELLAARGPRPGGALPWDVAYDAPCHLQHAQRVHDAPLALLRSIPGLRVHLLPGSDRCCGGAGIYTLVRPGMARAVLRQKIADIAAAEPRPRLVATGNPGCLMQIGAGLLAQGLDLPVAHPVELLDWSYRAGGVYRGAH